MNVLIIGGGKNSEHEVSLVSAASIARNIDKDEHTVYLAGITKDGKWYLQDDDELLRICGDENAALQISKNTPMFVFPPYGFVAGEALLLIDVVFPALHGAGGEDGSIQGVLEYLSLPYVGCGVMASAIAMDKEKTKQLWKSYDLNVVPGLCMRRWEFKDESRYAKAITMLEGDTELFGYPLFVKPCSAGSSVAVSKVNCRAELEKAIATAFEWDHKILIEKAIDAREIEIAVIGDFLLDGKLSVCGFGEVVPTHEFYDYDAKYNDPDGADLLLDPALTDAQKSEMARMATFAFTMLDCSGLARIDFFIDKKSGEIYLNELNTMPGFTPISMYPAICKHAGLRAPELISELLLHAMKRRVADLRLRSDLFGPPPDILTEEEYYKNLKEKERSGE